MNRKQASLGVTRIANDSESVEDLSGPLAGQCRPDTLRFVACGNADSGMSTLLGRLIREAQKLGDNKLETLGTDSARDSMLGDSLECALLMDGSDATRERGSTIDSTYRSFTTARRKFIFADTPVEALHTRHLIARASTAALALLLADARHGVHIQIQRDVRLAALMGVRRVVLAINKIDLVKDARAVFEAIRSDFAAFVAPLKFDDVLVIPVSALHGDNIAKLSSRAPWYAGPPLLEHLETVTLPRPDAETFVFLVQWVNSPGTDFHDYRGSVTQGRITVGDAVRVAASGRTTTVTAILTNDAPRREAMQGDAVTLRLHEKLDIGRGDMLCDTQASLETTEQFEVTLVWLHDEPGLPARTYDLKLNTQWAGASITAIKHRVDVETGLPVAATQVRLNDIVVCNLAMRRPLVSAEYTTIKALGAFVLVDHVSQATLAAGVVRHSRRRAQNVHHQVLSIGRAEREHMNGHRGHVVWFTGLSGSGKSTLANALEVALHARGRRTYILDGDNVRQGLNKDLGFTDADRVENIRRVAEVARLMLDAGMIVMTAFISPFAREREMARELIGAEQLLQVYVETTLEVCEARDPKGLYRKARRGELPNMTGIDSPYEPPERPDVVINGTGTNVEALVAVLLEALNLRI